MWSPIAPRRNRADFERPGLPLTHGEPRLALSLPRHWLGSVTTTTHADLPRTTGDVSPRQPAFVTTHWSVVLTANRGDTTRAQAALARLCETYWYPLYAFVRRQGHSPHDAQDLTQEFFARLLEKGYPSPTSFLFQTRESGIGLLQITGITDHPRGVKIRYKLVQSAMASAEDSSQSVASLPPVVVETHPVSAARDVEPGKVEIRVRFSKEMADGSWSWYTAWENSTPEFIGEPAYESDRRTCVTNAKLEPGRTYAFWLNSEKVSQLHGPRRPSIRSVPPDFPDQTETKLKPKP